METWSKAERRRMIDPEQPAKNYFLLACHFSVTSAPGRRTRGSLNHRLYRRRNSRRNSRLAPGALSGLVSAHTMTTYLLTILTVTVAFSAGAQTNYKCMVAATTPSSSCATATFR